MARQYDGEDILTVVGVIVVVLMLLWGAANANNPQVNSSPGVQDAQDFTNGTN